MTQSELAKRSGVSQVQIARYESGASKYPKYETLEKLAKALNISPLDLVSIDTLNLPELSKNKKSNNNIKMSLVFFSDQGGGIYINDSFYYAEESNLVEGITKLIFDYVERNKNMSTSAEELIKTLDLTDISLVFKSNKSSEEEPRE